MLENHMKLLQEEWHNPLLKILALSALRHLLAKLRVQNVASFKNSKLRKIGEKTAGNCDHTLPKVEYLNERS